MADANPLRGRKVGDRRVRVDRPHARYFRYTAPGVLEAKLAADEPATAAGRSLRLVRHTLFGRPLASDEELEQRLPKWKALPVFSSDVMSSVAYASEAALFTLAAAGAAAFGYLMPISILIVAFCSSSSRSATARRSGPTPTAAAATSSPAPTWACCPGLSRRRRSSSTTS